MAEKADLVASRGVGVVASGVFVGASIGVAFVILNIDDDEIPAGLSGSNVAFGFFFGVEVGAWGVVGGVTASGKVVGK